jgi:hypothetical protein
MQIKSQENNNWVEKSIKKKQGNQAISLQTVNEQILSFILTPGSNVKRVRTI